MSREIDERVAQEVFGWKILTRQKDGAYGLIIGDLAVLQALPCFSEDIYAAWSVVEALAKAPHWIAIEVSTLGIPHAKCYRNGKVVAEEWIDLDGVPDSRTFTARIALAICLAALEAVKDSSLAAAPRVGSDER